MANRKRMGKEIMSIQVVFEYISARDLYKLYYDEKLSPEERLAIQERLEVANYRFDCIYSEFFKNLQNSVKEWEWRGASKLHYFNENELMEIKKGEKEWLNTLKSLIKRNLNLYFWSDGNPSYLEYPEFISTEDCENPLIELMMILEDITLRIVKIDSWISEHESWLPENRWENK